MSQFIIGLRLDYLAEDGNRLLHLPLQEKGVAEVIAGERIGRTNFQLAAKFRGGSFEIALTKVDESNEIVGLGKAGIELQGGMELGERAGIVFLLRVRLAEKQVHGGIAGVLFEQAAEDFHGRIGLMSANEGRTPGEKQSRIVRRGFKEWTENFGGL